MADPDLETLRTEHAERLRTGGWRPVDVPARVFRYGVAHRSLVAAKAIGGLLLVGGLGLFALGFAGEDAVVRWIGFGTGSVFLAMGLLVHFAAHRSPRAWISVGPEGLRAELLMRRVEVPWHEVVSVSTQDLDLAGGGTFGRVHRVHTIGRDLSFSDRIEEADELVAIVRDAVARTWAS